MKHYFLSFFGFIFLISCGNPDYGAVEQEVLPLPLASESDDTSHSRPIQEVIDSYKDSGQDLGRKDHALIDLSTTAGGNALSKRGADSIAPNRMSRRESSHPPKPTRGQGAATNVELRITDQQSPRGSSRRTSAQTNTKIDILFYMQDRRSSCVKDFRDTFYRHHWFDQLNALDWQVGFSFFSEGERDLVPLAKKNGRLIDNTEGDWFEQLATPTELDYVLRKGEYKDSEEEINGRDVIISTLTPPNNSWQVYSYAPWRNVGSGTISSYGRGEEKLSPGAEHRLNTNGKVEDPLNGLNPILDWTPGLTQEEALTRDHSSTVVFMFVDDFLYYDSETWRDFINKHDSLKIYIIAEAENKVPNIRSIDNLRLVKCDDLKRLRHFVRH